jgi:ATP-dependent DNA helicase RecQ
LAYLRTDSEYNTLALTPTSRAVLRGDVPILLRKAGDAPKRSRSSRASKPSRSKDQPPPLALDDAGLTRFAALKAWRAAMAREHQLPAYVVFHDATLAEMAKVVPHSLAALGQISGVGAKKLDVYGRDILRVLND